MQIVLMCTYESGQVGFLPEIIEGIEAPLREYQIAGNQIILSGYDAAVLHRDADYLLGDSGVYRMPTPAEQEALAKTEQAASVIQEEDTTTPVNESPAPALSDQTDQADQSTKKKVSGG